MAACRIRDDSKLSWQFHAARSTGAALPHPACHGLGQQFAPVRTDRPEREMNPRGFARIVM
jgi:hypothetical protein